MPKGVYTRCDIGEWDPIMWCNRKAVTTGWLHEPYYTERKYFPLCKDHNAWLERPDQDADIDYGDWIKNNADV
jgi:hypothetical protein